MRYLSLFSGIEAASVAWEPLGWTPVAFAEIEPFPCALLAHRFPSVPNLGDVTQITAEQIAALGQIDVVIGGSPCQDLSVAGKRAGLRGERSSLFHEQVRIFNAARTLCGARWLVWENVPGAFSTHGGRDFARVVGDLAGCELIVPDDGWGSEGVALGVNGLVEWAVLDAQFFGVAQRRRRVFAILDVGAWADRPPVLLESESLRGNPPTRGEAGQGAPARALRSSNGGIDREDGHSLIAGTIGAEHGNMRAESAWTGRLIAHALDAFSSGRATEDGTGRGVPLTAHSLRADGFDASEDGTGRGTPLVPEVAPTLRAGGNRTGGDRPPGTDVDTVESLVPTPAGDECQNLVPVAFDERNVTSPGNRSNPQPGDPVAANQARTYTREGSGNFRVSNVAHTATQVRRLTPRECERLQGFPDDWTLVEHRGKPAADGPRYRALGNSMAVPVIRWIGRRIDAAIRALAD